MNEFSNLKIHQPGVSHLYCSVATTYTANNAVKPAHILYSSTSFGDTMHLIRNNSFMQPTQLSLWSVGKPTFLHDVYL